MSKIMTISGLQPGRDVKIMGFWDKAKEYALNEGPGMVTCYPPYRDDEVEIAKPANIEWISQGESPVEMFIWVKGSCKNWTTRMGWDSPSHGFNIHRYTNHETGEVLYTYDPGSVKGTTPPPTPLTEEEKSSNKPDPDNPGQTVGETTKQNAAKLKRNVIILAVGLLGGGIGGYVYNKNKFGGSQHVKRNIAAGASLGLVGGVVANRALPAKEVSGFRFYPRNVGSLASNSTPDTIKRFW